jgi:hypothetical protein
MSLVMCMISLKGLAQTPDSTLKPSPVKTLSDVQYNALIKGEDVYNMGLVAELNKYPSADKALKYKKELDLSPTQVKALTKIDIELKRKKIEMGNFIITNETKLDALFRAKKIGESDPNFLYKPLWFIPGRVAECYFKSGRGTYNLLSPGQVNSLHALKNHN